MTISLKENYIISKICQEMFVVAAHDEELFLVLVRSSKIVIFHIQILRELEKR
jgi:hypothetical protein